MVAGAGGLSFRALAAISLAGGALGAVLLLATPASFFARLVPWLVLFATARVRLGQLPAQAERTRARASASRPPALSSSPSPSMAAISAAASAF